MDAVFFDLFGTLVPNLAPAVWDQAMAEIAEVLEVEGSAFRDAWAEDFPRRMDGSIPDGPGTFTAALERLGAAPSSDRIDRANTLRRRILLEAMVPRDGAIEILDELASRGVAVALVSDCSTDAPELLDETPLGTYFAVRACSALLGYRKPDPRIYRHALDALGISPERVLYVGDGNSHELPGARELGMTTVWIDNGDTQYFEERFSPGGDHTVRDLREIAAILDRARDRLDRDSP